MKLHRLIYFILAIGIISSAILIYFYIIQRDFTKNHREFLISINKLENANAGLTYLILENSLYVYHNQDEISQNAKELENEYNNLVNSNILKNKNYKSVSEGLFNLKKELLFDLENIEEYLMTNAGIKNSLVFLTRHVENATSLNQEDKEIFLKANQILKHFHDAIKMQDLDYIDGLDILIHSNSQSSKTQEFINVFNLHANYLLKKYPPFINITKQVLKNDTHLSIKRISNNFSKLALNDFQALDIFASVIFTIFILSLLTIVLLFMKYQRENKKLLKTKESLEYSNTYDMLTGLFNRKVLEDDLSKSDFPHILVVNIDGFKHYNDIYGNNVGNILLKDLAKFLKLLLRVTNIPKCKVYRLGADEFGILFEDIDKKIAFDIGIELEKNIADHLFSIEKLRLNLTVSIASNCITPILENADLALKLIKKEQRSHVIEYKESLNLKRSVQENMETLELIKNAIADDRIIPFFQPIINLKTLKIEKYEALVRLQLLNGTFLSPFKFLDISKKTPYYYEITKIMIAKTIKVAEKFPKYRFSINISMVDILDDEITDILYESLKSHPLVCSRIDIELLEVEHLADIERVQEFIQTLHKFGSKVLIDDFGSGYSNFSYFSDLDIDIVKIDGSIVSEITTNERKLHMLKSMHQFSHGMGMECVAEFVETKESALLLRDIGVEYAQGYYFSQPLQMPLESDEVTI
ncbi:MAG: EAL domain-containing protein [Campylobacterales bacterium]|nr:EAL domain-containing protein [Campylobacterales bacterium]